MKNSCPHLLVLAIAASLVPQSLISQVPVDDSPSTAENFATATWGATVTGSSFNASGPYIRAIDGSDVTGWIANQTVPGTPAVLTINFSGTARLIESIRMYSSPISGTRLPKDFTIETMEGGAWIQRVVERGNGENECVYYLPAPVLATQMRLTVTGVPSVGLPMVNALEARGPLALRLVTGLPGETTKASTFRISGFTQPGVTVLFTPGGMVTADANGWASVTVPLVSGSNNIQFQTLHTGIASDTYVTNPVLNPALANFGSVTDRDGLRVAVKTQALTRLIVRGSTSDGMMDVTVKDITGGIVQSATLSVSNGSVFFDFVGDVGWYEITLSRGGTIYSTTGFSLSRGDFVLPSGSTTGCDVAMASIGGMVSAGSEFNYVQSNLSNRAGFGFARERFSWPVLQTGTTTFNWSAAAWYDEIVEKQRRNGKKVLLLTYSFPAFLNAAPNEVPSRQKWMRVPDSLLDTYTFAKELATHYKNKVAAYEFQNEADWANFVDSVNSLSAHQRAFYWGIKAGDPSALVLPCPMAFFESCPNQLLNLRGEAFDAFSFHWYPISPASGISDGAGRFSTSVLDLLGKGQRGFSFAADVSDIVRTVEGRSVWLSETGAWDFQPNATGEITAAAEQGQADFTAKAFPYMMSLGIDRVFPFILGYWQKQDQAARYLQYGYLRHKNYAPRPAMSALAATSELLRDATFAGRLNNLPAGAYGYVFLKSNGSYVGAFWADSDNVAYSLPSGITTTLVRDYLGKTLVNGPITSSLTLNKTAVFTNLNGVTASFTAGLDPVSATDPFPNSSQQGIKPSALVMRLRVPYALFRGPRLTDYYLLPVSASGPTSTTVVLEAVNLGTSSYTGPIVSTIGNKNWTVAGFPSTITIASMTRQTFTGTVTAVQRYDDTARLEVRSTTGGKTSYASEIFRLNQASPALPQPPSSVPDGGGNIEIAADTSILHSQYGYDPNLAWQTGSASGVGYIAASPASPSLSFTKYQVFKAPMVTYPVTLNPNVRYYVWVKAQAATTTDLVHVGWKGMVDKSNAQASEITGFGTAWTWKKVRLGGGAAYIQAGNPAGYSLINLWPGKSGIKVSKILLTPSTTFVPSS